MLFNKNYKFNVSLSTEQFRQKLQSKDIWKVQYRQQSTTADGLLNAVLQGHWYTYNFNTTNDVFGQKEKTKANFNYTNIISFDIDDNDRISLDMRSFIERLTNKPTFAYTTANNGIKGYRYRLVYLFNSPIKGQDNYYSTYSAIANAIGTDIEGYVIKDNCARSCNQQMAGTIEGADTYTSYLVYDVSDFNITPLRMNKGVTIKNNIKKEERDNINLNCDTPQLNPTFLEDLRVMRPLDFINKWGKVYDYYTHSELDFKDGYALIPEDYIEIYRSWFVVEENEKKHSRIHKWNDGEQRRKHLYIAALIMKKIRPSVTLEHLMFNLVVERQHYYNNCDNQLNNEVLYSIAKRVINTPLEKITLNSKKKKGKFVVDKEYWAEYGVNANQAKQIIKGEMKDFEIGNLYDCLLTDKQNIEVMKEYGLNIHINTLRNWRKKYGIVSVGTPKGVTIKNNIKKKEEDNINLNCDTPTLGDADYIEPFDNTYTVEDNSYDVEDYYYPVTNDVFANIVGVSTSEDWAELQAKFDALPSYRSTEVQDTFVDDNNESTLDTFDVDPYIYCYSDEGGEYDTTDENNNDYNYSMNNDERVRIESNVKDSLDEKLQKDWDKAMSKPLSDYAQALWDDLMCPNKENNRVWVSTLDF